MPAVSELAENLEKDIEELQSLLGQANRPTVVDGLNALLRKNQTALRKEQERAAAEAAAAAETERKKEASKVKLADLEQQKKAAVAAEDFELCAKLRDEIAALAKEMEQPSVGAPATSTDGVQPAPAPAAFKPAVSTKWMPLEKFAWDAGQYNSAWVNVYVSLEHVKTAESVTCQFMKEGLDLQVVGLNGKNYRLFKDNLEHEIVIPDCKYVVKDNRVTIKLKKVKGEYSYDNWTNFTAKKKKTAEQKAAEKANPSAGIMEMMKDMYDDGDDQMKKVIGEAMLKSRSGDKSMPDMPDL